MIATEDRQVMNRLASSLASHAQILAQHNALTRAALPQSYSGAMLRARYPGLGESALMALISELTGYVGARGHRLALTLDQVLALDERVASYIPSVQKGVA